MKRNKIRVLSSLAILGIAGISLIGCKGAQTTTGSTSTPAVSSSAKPTPTPTTNNNNSSSSVSPTTPVSGTNNGQTSSIISSTPIQNTTSTTPKVEVSSIVISGDYKTKFIVGESFTYEGLVVIKKLSDNTEVEAQTSEYIVNLYSDKDCENKVTDTTNLVKGTYYVLVELGDKFIDYSITVDVNKETIYELYDPASNPARDISEDTVLYEKNGNKVSVLASSSSKVTIDENKYTVGDYSFTSRIKLNGSALGTGENNLNEDSSGNVTNERVIVVNVANDCKLNIFARTGFSADTRALGITNLSDFSKELQCPDKMEKQTLDVKAGTYYIYSKKSGINIYGIEFEYEVDKSTISYSELTLDSSNVKVNYNINDTFSTDGLVVKALNSYGTYSTINNYTAGTIDMTTVGEKTVNISFGDLTATYKIQVINPNATVESIAVKTNPNNLVYRQGEELSLEGLVLTATDSDSLVQDVEYDASKVSHKVLNASNEDVTANFTTLTKGTYQVEVTYGGKSTTYDIVILEESGYEFKGESQVAVGAKSYTTELVISYNDGTDADYSKYYIAVADTKEGYTVSYYSDANYITKYNDVEKAFAQIGTVYVKCEYGNYSKTLTVSVIDASSVEDFHVTGAGLASSNKNGVELYNGNLINITTMSGEVKVYDDKIISGHSYLELKADPRGIIITIKEKSTIVLYINASGNDKNINLKNGSDLVYLNGTTSGNYSCEFSKNKTEEHEITITLEAGTYNLDSVSGSVYVEGIKATKVE